MVEEVEVIGVKVVEVVAASATVDVLVVVIFAVVTVL